jgi:hypothetical protein
VDNVAQVEANSDATLDAADARLFAAAAACVVLHHINGNATIAEKHVQLKDADATLHAAAVTFAAGGAGNTDANVKLHAAAVAFVALQREHQQHQYQQHHHMDVCPACANCAPPEQCPLPECQRPDQCPLSENYQPPEHAPPPHPSSSTTTSTTASTIAASTATASTAAASASAADHRRSFNLNANLHQRQPPPTAAAVAFCTAVEAVVQLEETDWTLYAADTRLFAFAFACVVPYRHITGNVAATEKLIYAHIKGINATLQAAAATCVAEGLGNTDANVKRHAAAVAFVVLEREVRAKPKPTLSHAQQQQVGPGRCC